MTSDDKCTFVAITFWAIVIIAMLVGAIAGIKYICVKTSSAIVSFQDNRKVAKEKKEVFTKTNIVAKKKSIESLKEARKIAVINKAEAKRAKEEARRVKHLAKLRESPSWNDEFGDLMWNADGTLKDPCTGDPYTAEQTYFILIISLVAVFGVWAGVGTGHPLGMLIAIIICLVGAAIIFSF